MPRDLVYRLVTHYVNEKQKNMSYNIRYITRAGGSALARGLLGGYSGQ